MSRAGGFFTDLRIVLRGRDFRRLFAIRISGQLGDGVFQIAMASYVFFSPERATTAADAAQAFAALLLPYSLAGPFAGVLLDRWRRRQVLLVANLVRAGLVAIAGIQMAADSIGPGLFLTALAALSVNRFILAGLSASLPHVVPRDELVMANAVFPTSGTIAAMLGAGVGYGLRELASSDVMVVAGAVVLFVTAGLCALLLHRDLLGPDDDPARPTTRQAARHVIAGVVDGARHVARQRPVAYGLLAISVQRFFYGIMTVATILMARNYFNDPAETDAGLATLALILGVSGVGFFVAAVLTPVAARRMPKERWAVILLIVSAVAMLMPGLLFTLPAVTAAAFVAGVASQGLKIVVDTVVQEGVEDAFRGRVFSFYDVLFNVMFVVAALCAALALPASGQSYPIVVAVALGFAGTGLW